MLRWPGEGCSRTGRPDYSWGGGFSEPRGGRRLQVRAPEARESEGTGHISLIPELGSGVGVLRFQSALVHSLVVVSGFPGDRTGRWSRRWVPARGGQADCGPATPPRLAGRAEAFPGSPPPCKKHPPPPPPAGAGVAAGRMKGAVGLLQVATCTRAGPTSGSPAWNLELILYTKM